MKKKIYNSPSMKVYELQYCACLLEISGLGGDNPFNLDDPGDEDR